MGTHTGITSKERQEIYERSKWNASDDYGRCAYCDQRLLYEEMVVDHFYPYSLEKGKALANYYVSCRFCNSIKGGRDFGYPGPSAVRSARVFINRVRKERGWYCLEEIEILSI